MARLDQLQLTDETSLGLVLVGSYLVLSAFHNWDLGGYVYSQLATANVGEISVSTLAAIQLSLLFALALLIGVLRVSRLVRRLQIRSLADVDSRLSEDAEYLGRNMARGRPRFLITPSLTDANAFCLPTFRQPLIVLGGGLRLLSRKIQDGANCIIAHECAHVARRDTFLLVAIWYLFLSFTIVVIANLVYVQATYWSYVANLLYENWHRRADLGPWILQSAGIALRNGIPSVVNAALLAIFLSHFIRLREYMADEVAAQYGFRQELATVLRQSSNVTREVSSFFSRFHPTSKERLEHVQYGEGWNKLDWRFCFAASALAAQVYLLIPDVDFGVPAKLEGEAANEFLARLGEQMSAKLILSMAASIAFSFGQMGLLIFVIITHTHRVTLTRVALGESRTCGFAVALHAWGVCLLGLGAGRIVFPSEMASMIDAMRQAKFPIIGADEYEYASFLIVSAAGLSIALLSSALTTLVVASRFHISPKLRLTGFLVALVLIALVVQTMLSTTMMLVSLAGISNWMREVDLAGLRFLFKGQGEQLFGEHGITLFDFGAAALLIISSWSILAMIRRGKRAVPSLNSRRLLAEEASSAI